MIRINGVMTTNFRRLQPLLVGIMERQALTPTSRAQAALASRGGEAADRPRMALCAPPAGALPA